MKLKCIHCKYTKNDICINEKSDHFYLEILKNKKCELFAPSDTTRLILFYEEFMKREKKNNESQVS